LQAACPERVLKPAGLASSSGANRAASQRSGINYTRPKKTRAFNFQDISNDASTTVFITPALVLLETRSLRSHALDLFTEYVHFVVEPRVLRLLCIAGT
jgi:hypothetical protein